MKNSVALVKLKLSAAEKKIINMVIDGCRVKIHGGLIEDTWKNSSFGTPEKTDQN
jgi:hypothetical protein